jgi:trehalose-6-phosphate synthase
MLTFMMLAFTLLLCTQIFRALAHGELLLQGMLSANIVGFHAFDHARHFLNAGKRLLGLSYQSIKVCDSACASSNVMADVRWQ